MRIGITFDLKTDRALEEARRLNLPDDFQEEFDSPHTINALADVIRGLGHEVLLLGDGREFLEKVLADPPDFVFNFAEGLGVSRSREARVPAVLEMLGVPYTGSDPLTMAVTLDKDCAKRLVASAGVNVPPSLLLEPGAELRPQSSKLETLRFPVVVKPSWEGSSKGIRNRCLVNTPGELPAVVEALGRDQRQPVLVEEYIEGDELTVGILGNDDPQVLGVMRVVPKQPVQQFIYSLEIKRDFRRLVDYQCPAPLAPAVTGAVRDAALAAYRALGCRDVARVDFRLRGGTPYFLEVNPLPGLHPEDSDLVIMAGLVGWTYPHLVGSILRAAFRRHGLPG